MPTYQKAYLLKTLREYPAWNEDKYQPALQSDEAANAGGADEATSPEELSDDSIVMVHEDLVVTKSCFDRDGLIFDDVTPAWEAFCKNTLKFEVPDWEEESRRVREKLAAAGSQSLDNAEAQTANAGEVDAP